MAAFTINCRPPDKGSPLSGGLLKDDIRHGQDVHALQGTVPTFIRRNPLTSFYFVSIFVGILFDICKLIIIFHNIINL